MKQNQLKFNSLSNILHMIELSSTNCVTSKNIILIFPIRRYFLKVPKKFINTIQLFVLVFFPIFTHCLLLLTKT